MLFHCHDLKFLNAVGSDTNEHMPPGSAFVTSLRKHVISFSLDHEFMSLHKMVTGRDDAV